MSRAPSLQLRLALIVGIGVALFWLVAAALTAERASREVAGLFDSDLRATAERLLPLALHDLRERGGDSEDGHRRDRFVPGFDGDDEGDHEGDHAGDRRLGDVAWRITDRDGAVVIQSEGATDRLFPPGLPAGFSDSATHRVYVATGRDGMTIAVAEPAADRRAVARGLLVNLALPLAVLLPLSLVVLIWAVRRGLAPIAALTGDLSRRGAQDLSPLPDAGLPRELRPITEALNQLLARLRSAFEAERSFAANAAHELRTPVAGAIAQTQRLRAETADAAVARRAGEIEATLKRLMRSSEKLMQLARAEGGRMQRDTASDVRAVVRIVAEDLGRGGATPCRLELPDRPVMSVIEPDALGILLRNLVENAQKHGAQDQPVRVRLEADGALLVANAGPVVAPETLARLTARFEKGERSDGTGLGLAIVSTIADRAGAALSFASPAEGQQDGLSVRVRLP